MSWENTEGYMEYGGSMSWRILSVSLVFLILSVVNVETTDPGTDVVYKYCKPWKWVSIAPGKCQRCPGCKRGQYHDNSTVVPLDSKRGALKCPVCTQCQANYYSDQHTRDWQKLRYCRRDRNCTMKNRLYKREPKRSRKSKCGRCIDGYIREKNWDDDDGVCFKPQVSTPANVKVTLSQDSEIPSPKHRPDQEPDHVDLERTVKFEAKRIRDHQWLHVVIPISIIVVGIICVLYLRKKCCLKESSDSAVINEKSNYNSNTPLMVDGAPSQNNSPEQSTIGTAVSKPSTTAPVSAAFGSYIDLQSSVSCADIKSVAWMRIDGDSVIDLVIDGQKYQGSTIDDPSLHISDLGYRDEGLYQCTASSVAGTNYSSVCYLKVTDNPDLELNDEEIAKAKKLKLITGDKLINLVAAKANDVSREGHMMQKLYDEMNIPQHKVTQLYEDFRNKGVSECIVQTLYYYVQKQGRTATVFSLYEALIGSGCFYELRFFVDEFRHQLSEKKQETVISMDDVNSDTKDAADEGFRGSDVADQETEVVLNFDKETSVKCHILDY